MTARRRRMSPEARRAQLIAVATQLIAEGGYNNLTMSRLASEAGITRAGIDHHFPSKEAVLLAVLRNRDELDLEAILPGGREWPTSPADSFAVLDALVHRNSEQREVVRLYTILSAEALDPSHPAHDYFQSRNEFVRTRLTSVAEKWGLDPRFFAAEVLGFMDGLQLQWLRDESLDLEALWRSATAGWREGSGHP